MSVKNFKYVEYFSHNHVSLCNGIVDWKAPSLSCICARGCICIVTNVKVLPPEQPLCKLGESSLHLDFWKVESKLDTYCCWPCQ